MWVPCRGDTLGLSVGIDIPLQGLTDYPLLWAPFPECLFKSFDSFLEWVSMPDLPGTCLILKNASKTGSEPLLANHHRGSAVLRSKDYPLEICIPWAEFSSQKRFGPKGVLLWFSNLNWMPILKIRILNLKIQIATFSRKMDCSSNPGLHFYCMPPILLNKIPDNKVCYWESSIYGSQYYFGCCCFYMALHLLFTTVPQSLFSHLAYPSVFKCFHFQLSVITFSIRTASQRGFSFREYVN